MILLDTHIFIWWIDNSPRLSQRHRQIIQERQDDGLGISIYSGVVKGWGSTPVRESDMGDKSKKDSDNIPVPFKKIVT